MDERILYHFHTLKQMGGFEKQEKENAVATSIAKLGAILQLKRSVIAQSVESQESRFNLQLERDKNVGFVQTRHHERPT